MTRIAMIGAGSTVFMKNLVGDILSEPLLKNCEIALMDIDEKRLATSRAVAERIASAVGAKPRITATADRRRALEGADYVVLMIQVAGYKPGTVTDFEVPKKHGLRQTIADTRELAEDIGVPAEEIRFLCAGINHMASYLSFERRLPDGSSEDLYPRIRRVLDEDRVPDWDRVRYEVFRHFGYFVTESSEHFAEYVPWFIKRDRPDLIERFNIPLDEYIRRCEVQIARWHDQEKALTASDRLEVKRSKEYAAGIILAEMTGEPIVINGNVENRGYIDNLPDGACVEVPCLVDHNGVQPVRVGRLPPQLAALMQTNINVQELTVEAIVTGRMDHAKHAAMLDPHTAAELSLEEISDLVDELLDAHGEWVPALDRNTA